MRTMQSSDVALCQQPGCEFTWHVQSIVKNTHHMNGTVRCCVTIVNRTNSHDAYHIAEYYYKMTWEQTTVNIIEHRLPPRKM